MTVTYEKNYRKKVEGPDWELMSDVSMRDSAIIHALEAHTIFNKEMCFNGMYQILKERYARRMEKSRCSIIENTDLGTIEVCGKSLLFPRFFIRKIDLKNLGK